MSQSFRHAFPFILTNQAQKEITHNEAIGQIDALLHLSAESATQTSPPPSPLDGQSWIIPTGATGAWEGQDTSIAQWASGLWRFFSPVDGTVAYVKDRSVFGVYENDAWSIGEVQAEQFILNGQSILASQQAAIADPVGGTVIDVEARAAVSSMLAALRTHGLIAT